jgi:hypothetical protein
MAGNVAEWLADIYGADYYASSPMKKIILTFAGAALLIGVSKR